MKMSVPNSVVGLSPCTSWFSANFSSSTSPLAIHRETALTMQCQLVSVQSLPSSQFAAATPAMPPAAQPITNPTGPPSRLPPAPPTRQPPTAPAIRFQSNPVPVLTSVPRTACCHGGLLAGPDSCSACLVADRMSTVGTNGIDAPTK